MTRYRWNGKPRRGKKTPLTKEQKAEAGDVVSEVFRENYTIHQTFKDAQGTKRGRETKFYRGK